MHQRDLCAVVAVDRDSMHTASAIPLIQFCPIDAADRHAVAKIDAVDNDAGARELDRRTAVQGDAIREAIFRSEAQIAFDGGVWTRDGDRQCDVVLDYGDRS